MIISVSRRSDIPRFQFDWFLERIEQGYVDVVNPFNAAQIRRVSLAREDAEFFVFWTRDPRPFLNAEAMLEKYPFYIMITLTGYPAVLEPDVPSVSEIAEAVKRLAKKWGTKRLIWRYDPVLLTSVTDSDFHLRNFADLSSRLSGSVERIIVSIYDEYARAKRRLAALEKNGSCRIFQHYTEGVYLSPEVRNLLEGFAALAGKAGMEIRSCAEAEDLKSLGIKPGACIDGALIREIAPGGENLPGPDQKDKNQRAHCLCVPSVDIGRYGPCPAGCVYCYARR